MDATYRAGAATLVSAVSLSVPPACLTVIAGPNGAGKSTLLKLLTGDLQPSAGSVTLGHQCLTAYSPRHLAQHRAVMPQTARPAFGLKVWELVQAGRAPFGESDRVAQAHVQAALERVDALELADRQVDTLSGGERQRIFLAKSLCQVMDQPNAYLLLDEPTSALDLKQAQRVLRILREAANDGLGVCAILHDLTAARRYADRVYLLSGGRLHSQGEARSTLKPCNISHAYEVDLDTAKDAIGVA